MRRRRVAALIGILALIAVAVGAFFVLRSRTEQGVATLIVPPPRGLALGLDEENASLLGTTGPAAFAPWRQRLAALDPTFVRLDVVWSKLQPAANDAPDWNQQQSGCVRDVPPCAPYDGLRGQLHALAEQQRAHPGRFVGYVVLFGAPPWATAPRHGCVPPNVDPTGLTLSDEGRAAYGRFVAGVLGVARQEGADLRYWSAWNEPNQPAFLSPQRDGCHVNAPAVSPDEYAALVRELRVTLDEAPGDQQLVLGETAAYDTPRPTAASTVEFVDGLPQDVVCASDIWAQHAYVGTEGIGPVADLAGDPGKAGSAQLLTALEHALDRRGCSQREAHLDHRDRGRRPQARRPAPDQRGRAARPVPGAERRPAGVVPGPARGRGLPVHVPRGQHLPGRPGQHRPDRDVSDLRPAAGLERPRLPDRPTATAASAVLGGC